MVKAPDKIPMGGGNGTPIIVVIIIIVAMLSLMIGFLFHGFCHG